MSELPSLDALSALLQVVVIDLVLAGDNAVVIGIAAATLLRILFALLTTQLMQIVGLLLAGGILLLWVCWKMWRELRATAHEATAEHTADGAEDQRKTLWQATTQIIVADVSMSLDNVLAVAGAAREQPIVLVFGLALSIAMMGAAATFIAKLLQNHRWIAYVGLAVILYVAVDMTIRGASEIAKVAPA